MLAAASSLIVTRCPEREKVTSNRGAWEVARVGSTVPAMKTPEDVRSSRCRASASLLQDTRGRSTPQSWR
jgi:hypothetical protein